MKPVDVKRFEDLPERNRQPGSWIAFEIDRASVVAGDKSSFLEFWDIDRIFKAGRIHDLFDKVAFCVSCYDSDPRELFEIAEARLFLRGLADAWPYFFYVARLDDAFLMTLVRCMVPTLTVQRGVGLTTDYRVAVKASEVNEVCNRVFSGLTHIAKMDPSLDQVQFDSRVAGILKYMNSGMIK